MAPGKTMKAVDIKGGAGPISALFINADMPTPPIGKSEALVKVKAFGLNRMDILQREGHYPVPPQASKVLGVEFSGIIEQVGAEPERGFQVGDEVFGLAYGGAYAEYIAVSTHMLVHKPAALSWAQAAGIPEVWLTAIQALYVVGGYKPGKSLLWHAGASSVSIAGIQLVRADGAGPVYATVSTQEKIDFLETELSVTKAFSYKTQPRWDEEVLKATGGRGVDMVIDFVGQQYFEQNLNVAALDGTILILGLLSGMRTQGPVDLSAFIRKRLRVEGSSLRSRDVAYQGNLRDLLVEHAMPKFIDGTFKIFVEKIFPWEQVQDAHALLESNTTKGKIICTID